MTAHDVVIGVSCGIIAAALIVCMVVLTVVVVRLSRRLIATLAQADEALDVTTSRAKAEGRLAYVLSTRAAAKMAVLAVEQRGFDDEGRTRKSAAKKMLGEIMGGSRAFLQQAALESAVRTMNIEEVDEPAKQPEAS